MYFKNGLAKLEFSIGKGKNAADKRESAKERTAQREIDKALSKKW